MIKLEEKYLKQVKEILLKNLKDTNIKVFVFGSRTKQKCRQYSDLDLALKLEDKKIDYTIISNLKYDFEESLIPIKVDILDLNNISDNFKKCIENDLTELEYNF